MTDKTLPRVVVPFTLVYANSDNPGLKDFSPAVLPADAPDEDEEASNNGGESGDGADPKVSDSSAQGSAPSSQQTSVVGATPGSPEDPASAEKDSETKDKAPKE